jgi:hypothetical protein
MTALRVQSLKALPTFPLMVRSALLRASRTMRPDASILILRDAAKKPLLRMRAPAGGEAKEETAR